MKKTIKQYHNQPITSRHRYINKNKANISSSKK